MKKHFSTFLIIAGILIIAVPLGGRYLASRRQAELMESFLEQVEAEECELPVFLHLKTD